MRRAEVKALQVHPYGMLAGAVERTLLKDPGITRTTRDVADAASVEIVETMKRLGLAIVKVPAQ